MPEDNRPDSEVVASILQNVRPKVAFKFRDSEKHNSISVHDLPDGHNY